MGSPNEKPEAIASGFFVDSLSKRVLHDNAAVVSLLNLCYTIVKARPSL